MVETNHCPECGEPLAPSAPGSLCPKCLLKLGLDQPSGSPESAATTREEGSLTSEDEQQHIGPYHVLQKLGEGGMGEVWLAEQHEPVRRKVALKLIKAGMDTKQVIGRFESERQALALMNHPSIARVFDAGATERGLPYFAMEYVKGEPITSYCDRHRLSMQERLELFMQCVRRSAARSPERDHPPRHQTVERAGGDSRRQAGAEDHRFRRGQGHPATI